MKDVTLKTVSSENLNDHYDYISFKSGSHEVQGGLLIYLYIYIY